jgi:hypothetical protein
VLFQEASKWCNVVELSSWEWAVDEDNKRDEYVKGDQALGHFVILLIRKVLLVLWFVVFHSAPK